ncbi:MAG: pantoate--beta-alanine ligase [Desulfocucumaceae bacterium]
MLICETIAEIRDFVRKKKAEGKSVGFVPTMGYLHGGHLSLVEKAREECGAVVASIFVNPLQFGPKEDFTVYPRDLGRDCAILEKGGAGALFHPPVEAMYTGNFSTHVDVTGLTDCLCGRSRPGHFRGVATVVAKLFNIVQPDRAYFGQKDAQQVLVIRKMVEDLNMPVEIVAVSTVREADGLAMSSRNVYLSPDQRAAAPVLYDSLRAAARAASKGERDSRRLVEMVRNMLSSLDGASIDYVEIRSLPDLKDKELLDSPSLLALAVKLGKTRLIDNIVLE